MSQELDTYKCRNFKGSHLRLLEEWISIDARFQNNKEVAYIIRERNGEGLPVVYEIIYNIRSFCNVLEADENGIELPVFADRFVMRISIPNNFPSVESKLVFKFLTESLTGNKIPHPWHPNIRFFGDFVGRVCLNKEAFSSFTSLSLFIERVALYLKYEKYHAIIGEKPFPEDEKVAEWVMKQAEPNGWIDDLKNKSN